MSQICRLLLYAYDIPPMKLIPLYDGFCILHLHIFIVNTIDIQTLWFGVVLQLKDHPPRITPAYKQRDDSGEVQAFMGELSHLDMLDINQKQLDAEGKELHQSLLDIQVISQANTGIYFHE